MPIFAPKLRPGDGVRVIAPSCTLPSMPWMTDELWAKAKTWFERVGCPVSEGKYLRECDALQSASIANRLADLHAAFADPDVGAIFAIRGGWNVNQLLPSIDYSLIKKHPKILCGFSDITALSNAIFAKTKLVTYSGPNFNQFAFMESIPYTWEYLEAAIMKTAPIRVMPSDRWTDEHFSPGKPWTFKENEGWWAYGTGDAEGMCIGGNLCTLNLLQGTEWMPIPAEDTVLLIEDDHETHPRTFDRDLASLTQQPWFSHVRGVLIGRFEGRAVNTEFGAVTRELLTATIGNNARLSELPIIANVDFGHTNPMVTWPIGGRVRMQIEKDKAAIEIVEH